MYMMYWYTVCIVLSGWDLCGTAFLAHMLGRWDLYDAVLAQHPTIVTLFCSGVWVGEISELIS